MAASQFPSWQLDDIPCARRDPEIWFPDHAVGARKAKELCAGCPSKTPCLAFAVRHNITDGVFGGASPNERRILVTRAGTGGMANADRSRRVAPRKVA
jgi:WhiB family transcriptional regulator, redox-sensing transcriptional regulator